MLLRTFKPVSVLLASAAVILWVLASGCSQSEARLGDDTVDASSPPPTFTKPSDGGASTADVDAGPPPKALLCTATECPDGFATCTSDDGPAYKCGTDLMRDPKNCGSCGNECLVYKPLHMTSRCVQGACELECMNDPFYPTDRRNCNGEVDDGCEVDVLVDPNNCGACGNKCAADQPCLKGKCGCPPNQIFCDGMCVDPKSDDFNCGGCGIVCDLPKDACDPLPTNAGYGCKAGTCGHLKCGGFSRDCNDDMAGDTCKSDGCEVDDVRTDKNNCGGCGIKCIGQQECVDEGNGPECAVPCTRFGKVLCPNTGMCTDLLNDPANCGGCGAFCANAGPHQVRSCKKGLCDYECEPGYADCNGNTADGCETNLMANPGHCGSCGNRCDIGAGQPCVEGTCLMKECDEGTTK